MARHAVSTVRAAAFRRKCLSLAKTCSIGFRSGEYLGRKKLCSCGADERTHNFASVAAEIVHDYGVAAPKRRKEDFPNVEAETLARNHGPRSGHDAGRPGRSWSSSGRAGLRWEGSRCCRTHPTAVLTSTPNCLAASLQDNPPVTTAATTASEDPQSKACPSMLASSPAQHGESETS